MTPADLREVLTASSTAWKFLGAIGPRILPETVLAAGIDCIAQPLPARFKQRRPKKCFTNAAALVRRSKRLTYVEGYAVREDVGIPIHHAWAIDADRRVIDPTWDDPETAVYIGIPVPMATYDRLTVDTSASALLGDPHDSPRFDFLLSIFPGLAGILETT